MSDANQPHHDKFHTDNTNEVVDFVDKIKTGWMSWGDWLLGLMLLASASFFAYTYYHRHLDNTREEAFHDLATSDSPDVLAVISQKATYGTVGPQAALRAADLYLKKAESEADAGKSKELLAKAQKLYQGVASNAALPVVFHANALLGLASVNETQNDWTGAQDAYNKVIAQTGGLLPNLAALAKARLDLLPSLEKPVAFGEEPAPAAKTGDGKESAPETKPETTAPPAKEAPPAPAAPKGLDAPLQ